MTALPSLSTPQAALDALDTSPSLTVYIGGVLTDVVSYSGDHARGRSAVGRLQLLLPVDDHVVPGAAVEVQAGHNDLIGTVFSGFIPNDAHALTIRGAVADVQIVGWSKLLDEDNWETIAFTGPVALDAVFAALCEHMDVPSYTADPPTYIDGTTPVELGGNPQIDGGVETFREQQSLLAQLQRKANDYGYYIQDMPWGPVSLRQISGMPNTDPVIAVEEGVHLVSARRDRDYSAIVNYWDIQGQEYEDEFGALIPIRSRPDEVPFDERIRPDGVRRRGIRSSDIVREDQAEAIRQRLEIDTSEPEITVSWTGIGLPGIGPGDVVSVTAPTVGIDGDYWLLSMRQTFSIRDGFAATFEAWAGSGEALPSLVERSELVIDDNVSHLGDEYVGWYAKPTANGTRKTWDFTLTEKASHANVRCYAHSWNSQLSGGQNKDLNVSKWEVWEAGASRTADQPVASGTLPVMNENYNQRPDFSIFTVVGDVVTNAGYWTQTAVPLSRLDPGDYELDFVCGRAAGFDDGEVRRIRLELYAANDPAVIT